MPKRLRGTTMRDRSIREATRRRLSPPGRADVFALLVGAAIATASPQLTLAAVPSLSTAKTAVATSTCQQAQVTLQVNGVGDPVTQRLPLDVMIVFDRSGSMDDAGGNPPQPITDAKNAAITLINQLNNTTDTAGLTSFSTTATLDQALTSNFAAVTNKVNAISVGGNTNIGGGVKTGQQEIATHGRASPTVHVMVVLTDGVANRTASGTSCATNPTSADTCTQDAINQAAIAKAAGTIVFTIGLNLNNLGSATAAVARAELQAMASNSNDYYEAPTSSQLSNIFSQIATVITNVAGSNIVVTDILPTGVQYVAGSASPAPTSVAGQTLTWNLGLLDIGSSSSMTFLVTLNPATPNQLVDVFPDSRINYNNYQGSAASTPFPETHVTVPLCPTATSTVTSTPTITPTPTVTGTATSTATNTADPTATATATSSATATPTITLTPTWTQSATATATATYTATATETFTATETETPTATQTPTITFTGTPLPTWTATDTGTPTDTPTATATGTSTKTATATATGTDTATATNTATATATATATVTATDTETATPTITPTATPTPFCGDGHVDPGESCDDGNQIAGDGCEPDCTVTTACELVYPGQESFVGGCGAPSYADIQSAIDAAADGDTVTICPGAYGQPVQVTKQIKIRAATVGTAIVHTIGTAFDVRRSGVEIDGLTIQSDTAAAISADSICPLFQSSCAAPGSGSHLTISNNTIQNSPIGIAWQRRIDCVEISGNSLTSNTSQIALLQQEGSPAVQVSIVNNDVTGGGESGAAISLSGLGATVAANLIQASNTAGLVLADMTGGGVSQVIENIITASSADGITIKDGADGTAVHDNNFIHNAVGLGNESSSGALDATLNWWGSQTGPSGMFTGHGDKIVDRSSGTTQFIEFLCAPFPEGFPSILGVCSTEVPELREVVPGRSPDLDPFGRYIAFESAGNLNVDPRQHLSNADGSQEIFLMSRRPRKKLGGVCLGGVNACDFDDPSSCTHCAGHNDCPGDPSADPIVLNGECVNVTQLSDGTALQMSEDPRLSGLGKHTVFSSDSNMTGANPDGSLEVMSWSRPAFETNQSALKMVSDGAATDSYSHPVPSLSGQYIVVESNGNPTGENADGNPEIFVFNTRNQTWTQLTHTLPPVENHRPASVDGRRILFDSTGDFTGHNADGNRELFLARIRSKATEFTQITDTVDPVENRSGSLDAHGVVIAFSSNGDFVGQNADGNREIFTWFRKTGIFTQITNSPSGDNANPIVTFSQRYIVFESTADLTSSGANNRRIFVFDRTTGKLLLLSRSRFGVNQSPRISHHRFIAWESTANLTGKNAGGDWVIYLFDRKKD